IVPASKEKIAPFLVALSHNAPTTNGPAEAETMPPIPIHMDTDKYFGGDQAIQMPTRITKKVAYRLIISSIFSDFSFLIFSFGTIVFLKISFANNCVRETINPSDVDITA